MILGIEIVLVILLYQNQQLEPLNPNRRASPFDRDSAYALGITERDSDEFKALEQYLTEKQKQAYRNQYPGPDQRCQRRLPRGGLLLGGAGSDAG